MHATEPGFALSLPTSLLPHHHPCYPISHHVSTTTTPPFSSCPFSSSYPPPSPPGCQDKCEVVLSCIEGLPAPFRQMTKTLIEVAMEEVGVLSAGGLGEGTSGVGLKLGEDTGREGGGGEAAGWLPFLNLSHISYNSAIIWVSFRHQRRLDGPVPPSFNHLRFKLNCLCIRFWRRF